MKNFDEFEWKLFSQNKKNIYIYIYCLKKQNNAVVVLTKYAYICLSFVCFYVFGTRNVSKNSLSKPQQSKSLIT